MRKYYGSGLSVDWTADEYTRLEAIKREHFDNPKWAPPRHIENADKKTDAKQIQVYISQHLYKRICERAVTLNVTVSALVRGVMEAMFS